MSRERLFSELEQLERELARAEDVLSEVSYEHSRAEDFLNEMTGGGAEEWADVRRAEEQWEEAYEEWEAASAHVRALSEEVEELRDRLRLAA